MSRERDSLTYVFPNNLGNRYNGYLPPGDRGRRRSKFVLYKRPVPNGIKRSKHYIVKTPHSSQAILNTRQHSISYTLSRTQAIIVEYTEDEKTDMFQVKKTRNSSVLFLRTGRSVFSFRLINHSDSD